MNNYVKAKIKLLTVLMLASMIAVGVVFAVSLYYIVYLPSTAIVPGVEIKIYNVTTGVELTNLNWDTVVPGINNTLIANVTNTGSTNVTLTLEYTGLPAGWILTWNYTKSQLNAKESVIIELLLYVKADEFPGPYSWITSVRADVKT